ncbi:MAG TPA: tRNA preQ1(34) S-adenosylmethionine ribosyltransferase-isomerase QueA [Anaerolineae bacterium]|nr:tRNA preQ1(34) S-adenosylmethionine ribosyltransferase-isomerase QueA [Anaerolineae bacterium]
MKTAEFDYELASELIAQTPIEPRDSSRLMVVDRRTGKIAHRHFCELPDFLQPGDLLVHNESRVIPARLFACKPTGGKVEILLLRQRADDTWETLVKGKRARAGLRLTLLDGPDGQPIGAEAKVVEEGERGARVLAFDRPALSLAERVGVTPLPPYIHTPLQNAERYQTIYARVPGSAASATAGLHFTPELLLRLREMEVRSAFVTLHIGLDTFRPVSEEQVEAHHMHTEHCSLSPEVAKQVNQAKLAGQRVIAVGTTSVRTLETAALATPGCPWRSVAAFEGDTDLFICPGFRFRVVDTLITNFHLPRSTLLMLVAAFTGKELLDRAYAEAIEQRYRFYSFGDAMLVL